MSQRMIAALNEFRMARIHHDVAAETLATQHINEAQESA